MLCRSPTAIKVTITEDPPKLTNGSGMPVTGIPLPLMSFGGSSVVVTFMAIGLLQSIYVQARLTSKSRADLLAGR